MTRLGFSPAASLDSLDGATGWLNSPPLSARDLAGRVVLVNFCTYSCINWLRQLPYVRSWADTYRDAGLLTLGVHTPEFGFEHDLGRVTSALRNLDVRYPVAVDSGYAIWNGFDNSYWPALYFIDATGRIRRHHFGEGDYDASERFLRQLLAEADPALEAPAPRPIAGRGIEAPADWEDLRSPETYLGYLRTQDFTSPEPLLPLDSRTYSAPARLHRNRWALSGEWTFDEESVSTRQEGASLAYRFHARDVHLVLGPRSGRPVRFRVTLDGLPPGSGHGGDTDEDGYGVATEHRLYQLVRQTDRVRDRLFEITALDPGLEAFVFTFG